MKYMVVLNSYAHQYAESSPNEQEWSQTDAICEFLIAFEEATNLVSADRTHSTNVLAFGSFYPPLLK